MKIMGWVLLSLVVCAVMLWVLYLVAKEFYAVAQAMIEQWVAAKIAPREKYMVVYSGMDIENFLNSEYDEKPWNRFTIPQAAMKGKDNVLDDASIRKTIEDPNNYKKLEMKN